MQVADTVSNSLGEIRAMGREREIAALCNDLCSHTYSVLSDHFKDSEMDHKCRMQVTIGVIREYLRLLEEHFSVELERERSEGRGG